MNTSESLKLVQPYTLDGNRLVLVVIQVFSCRLLIDYIDGESEYAWKGYLLAVLLFVNNVIRALLMHSHYRYTCIGAIHIKMALTAAIYKKVIDLIL